LKRQAIDQTCFHFRRANRLQSHSPPNCPSY